MNTGDRDAAVNRMLRLLVKVGELVVEGKREPDYLNEFLQGFVFGSILPDINWQLTYRKAGLEREYELALKVFTIPSENLGLWTMPMIKYETICAKMVAAFRRDGVVVNAYREDLDTGLQNLHRDPKEWPYLVRFRRVIEANEHSDKSANDLAAISTYAGINLPEGLTLHYGYYVTTGGGFLDTKVVTRCDGSRDSGGNVPSVCSDGGEVCVDWDGPGDVDGDLCSRSVVPADPACVA